MDIATITTKDTSAALILFLGILAILWAYTRR